jgi:hypothetical protein
MSISDRELDRRLAGLAREAEAPGHLWQRIEAGMNRRASPWRPAWAAVAASVLVAALVVTLVPVDRTGNGFPAEWDVIASSSQRLLDLSLYEIAGPASTGGMAAGWQTHHDAVEELKKALEQNPGNALLLDLLVRARLREMEMINGFNETWRV